MVHREWRPNFPTTLSGSYWKIFEVLIIWHLTGRSLKTTPTSAETCRNIRQITRTWFVEDIAGKWLQEPNARYDQYSKIVYFGSWKIPGFPVGNLAGLYCHFGRQLAIVGYYIFKITGFFFFQNKIVEILDKFWFHVVFCRTHTAALCSITKKLTFVFHCGNISSGKSRLNIRGEN